MPAPLEPSPLELGKFEFVRLATLRTAQLIRGCTPRVPAAGKMTTTAQREVALGKVCSGPRTSARDLVVVPST